MADTQTKAKLQVLHFLLQGVRFCVDIQFVEKVLALVLIETIPNSAFYLVGLMNLAGKSIPVIDLALRLGLERKETYQLDTPILLCSIENRRAGLLIDKIIGLSDIEPLSIQSHTEFDRVDSPFLASISLETEVSLLINVDHILAIDLSHGNRELV